MIRFAIFFIALAINVSTIPALASQCALSKAIGASLTRWAAIRRQLVNATDHEMACRVLAASFYESVATRQAAMTCARNADVDPDIGALVPKSTLLTTCYRPSAAVDGVIEKRSRIEICGSTDRSAI
jgi:hypothetical protein